ncbi:MAG: bifunctional oligoribonuclease/PAP phosphatase NrnA [Desulfovibrio sp.]|nr:MAG: bifunctional oligoribonuclease/PAP phosphatase NrnA [Desulfovibrio sp.]
MWDKDKVRQILENEDHFLVTSHANPDGDALGSTCAMGWILKALGKDFRLYNTSGVPDQFDWLEFPSPLEDSLGELSRQGFTPKWVIAMDCGDFQRMGEEPAKALDPARLINIDHHTGNKGFGAVNWVDTAYPAVGEMIAELADDLAIELSGHLGEAVYLAVVSDTGNYTYGNTRAETLELGARIVRLGLHVGRFNAKYQKHWSMNRLKLWSQALSEAALHSDGNIGVVRVTKELLTRTSTSNYDLEGLVNFIRRVKGVRVSTMLRENGDGRVKFSLRSDGDDNVQRVAAEMGGGGHKNAAAGFIKGSLDAAEQRLIASIQKELGLE